jgi:hypothetical protein
MDDDRNFDGAHEPFLADLVARSSVGDRDEVGKDLAQRMPRGRVDAVMRRMREQSWATSRASGSLGDADVRRFVQKFVAWLSATENSVASQLDKLFCTVADGERYSYVSRRVASHFLTNSRVLPFPLDNPVLPSPYVWQRQAEDSEDSEDSEIFDDAAVVLSVEGRPLRVMWPKEISPQVEDYLVALADKIYVVDLKPHSYWKLVSFNESAHDSFLILFVWRVVDPSAIVRNRTADIPQVFDDWLIQRKSFIATIRKKDSPLSERDQSILCQDRYWQVHGLVVDIEFFSYIAVSSYEACPLLPSVERFLHDALVDDRRWFAGTESLITNGRDMDGSECDAPMNTMISASRLVLTKEREAQLEPIVPRNGAPRWPEEIHSERPLTVIRDPVDIGPETTEMPVVSS